jgi:exodeoxyribonuclease V alpha subunit
VVERGRRLVELARCGDAAGALDDLRRLQVLAARRGGPLGVQDWNQRVDRALTDAGLLRGAWSAGRPVMVSANDPLNGLFNGDVGVTVAVVDGRGRRGRTAVAFDASPEPRLVDPSRLDRHERLWAMTIHKSQGSEFAEVVVTLPPPPSPILTRELLYTAVTRARRGVTIVASEASIRAAVERPVHRSSGLAERLA